jgi:hypothetical protein
MRSYFFNKTTYPVEHRLHKFRDLLTGDEGLDCYYVRAGGVRLLNKQTIGKDDVFGSLIKHISFLQGGSTQYGFVVGSEKQPLGCATAMLKVVIEIDDSLKRCAKDLNW